MNIGPMDTTLTHTDFFGHKNVCKFTNEKQIMKKAIPIFITSALCKS